MIKNNKGFTLIELIVCFALITIVSLSIFKTVLSMQEKQIKNTTYNSYLSFVSVLNNTIQNDFLTDTISNVTSCGVNCFDITYLKKGIVRLEADKENNTVSYGGSSSLKDTVNCPNGYSANPISKCAKSGNGYARITYISQN